MKKNKKIKKIKKIVKKQRFFTGASKSKKIYSVKSSKAGAKQFNKARRTKKSISKKPLVKNVKKAKMTLMEKKLSGNLKKEEGKKVLKMEKLVKIGKDRGFVTYGEILKEFPRIEKDILLLEELYDVFSDANVDILEGGGMLNLEDSIGKDIYTSDSTYDSIQMYLKEIGRYELINAEREKELAKRIEAGDEEAKNILARANL
ncbi:hypothetical protein KJ828_01715, partial [Patescibacteria group bacterium]|nr:hypothetical protein [Patescibacteria group bacterium]